MLHAYEEQQSIDFEQDVMAAYLEAGQPLDLANVVWAARMTYDAVTMGYPASRAKHLNELRVQLGLGPRAISHNPLPLLTMTIRAASCIRCFHQSR